MNIIREKWEALPSFAGEPPVPPPLGYRGCFVKCPPGEEWSAYGGVVTRKIEGRSLSRLDEARFIEKTVLASAPAGLLPEIVL